MTSVQRSPRGLQSRRYARQNEQTSTLPRSVLLVQVSTNDEGTNIEDTAFVDAFFANDTYSVATHWSDCSAGRALSLVLYDVTNPVVTVRVVGQSASYNRTTLFLEAKTAVESKLALTSSLASVVDHVVFCVPSGLSGPTFLASGAFDSYWMVAKPQACTDPAVLFHELGHLYALKHAGQGDLPYGDETSLMGQTVASATKPVKYRCFNGQNFWKLGWFADLSVEIIPLESSGTRPSAIKLELASYLDVSKVPQGLTVVVKVLDLFLVYNRRSDYNVDTGDFPNMVTVVRELDDQNSSLLAGLDDSSASSVFRYDTGGSHPLTIQICDRIYGDALSPDRFTVAIGYESLPCASDANVETLTPTMAPMQKLVAAVLVSVPPPVSNPISSLPTPNIPQGSDLVLPMIPTVYPPPIMSSKLPSTRVSVETQAPYPPIDRQHSDLPANPKNSLLGLSVGLTLSFAVLAALAVAAFRRNKRLAATVTSGQIKHAGVSSDHGCL